MDKVSIIVPVYNVEKYLEKCIESILAQTFKNIEVILVNDGSSDKSGLICDKYSLIDRRIKVVHKKNTGVSDSRNYGIKVSSGKYIAFIDSDDWVDKEYINILYSNLIKYNADISVCDFIRENNESKPKQLLKEKKEILFTNIEALNQIYGELYVQMIAVVWNKLYKREIFNDLKFPIDKIHEDEYLTPIALYKCNKIIYTNKQLLHYRDTPNSIMNKKFNVKRLDYLYVLESRMKFFKENMLDELYKKNVCTYLEKVMEFYFLVKRSDIENKKNIMKELKNKLSNLNKNLDIKLPKKLKIEMVLFKVYPNLYYLMIWITLKIKGYRRDINDKVKK